MSRVVMFVLNDVRTDARVLREAASLTAVGHSVTIVGRPTDPLAAKDDRETRDGFEILRIHIPGHARRFVLRHLQGRSESASGTGDLAVSPGPTSRAPLPRMDLSRLTGVARDVIQGLSWLARWHVGARAWAVAAAAAAPPADIWHGHDLTGLGAAQRAADARGGPLVYDAHEIYLEAGTTARQPAWAKRLIARLERRWLAKADALVAVNEGIADELHRRYGAKWTVVVHNCPPRWTPPESPAPKLRAAIGIPAGQRIALYHGAFVQFRGVEVLADALLEPGLEDVHAVFLGAGPLRDHLVDLAASSLWQGRIHVLRAVDPLELPGWIEGADVGVMPSSPSTLNHWLATPNKLFECIGAGVPVVASDFPGIRAVVCGDPDGPLGEVCDPESPRDVARAIRQIVGLSKEQRRALGQRCLAAAHARWNWETESARLVALYEDLGHMAARDG
jgi:glycosyltransferase involved in cell wall biosynthesis